MARNMNELARQITVMEGLEESLSVAQVKEVLGIVGDLMHSSGTVTAMLIAAGARRAKAQRAEAARKAGTLKASKRKPTAKRGKKA